MQLVLLDAAATVCFKTLLSTDYSGGCSAITTALRKNFGISIFFNVLWTFLRCWHEVMIYILEIAIIWIVTTIYPFWKMITRDTSITEHIVSVDYSKFISKRWSLILHFLVFILNNDIQFRKYQNIDCSMYL